MSRPFFLFLLSTIFLPVFSQSQDSTKYIGFEASLYDGKYAYASASVDYVFKNGKTFDSSLGLSAVSTIKDGTDFGAYYGLKAKTSELTRFNNRLFFRAELGAYYAFKNRNELYPMLNLDAGISTPFKYGYWYLSAGRNICIDGLFLSAGISISPTKKK